MEHHHKIFLLTLKWLSSLNHFSVQGLSIPVNLQSSTGPHSGGEGGGVLENLVCERSVRVGATKSNLLFLIPYWLTSYALLIGKVMV